ncbi:MAG: YdcF family protein [Candidatus Omnitrophica bacterium]|nr:YdcF family protein [Candidatus Omnitrophota bacterium]
MIKNKDIICISSIDWDFIWQGHQQIMSALAKNGNRVLFIENTGVRSPNLNDIGRLKKRIHNWLHSVKGIRKESDNLYVYSPLILPFPYSRIARWFNKRFIMAVLERWTKSVGFSSPIIWTFLPTGIVLDIINSIDSSLVIYYCIDNFSVSSPFASRICETERNVIRRSDLVFVTAKNLYERCLKDNRHVYFFPFGVNLEVYEKAKEASLPVPRDIAGVKRPIIGYVGGVHKWVDTRLIKFLSDEHRDKNFVFVGPVQTKIDDLKSAPNISFLGQKPYEELPGYVKNFDICVIPYLITEYTKNVYPTKLTEYLSLGKTVVSTAIPEVEAFNERNGDIVYLGRSMEKFSELINSALLHKPSEDIISKRMAVAAREGDWKIKIEDMTDLIERALIDKERQKASDWKNNLIRAYKASRKKLVPVLLAALISYGILFHTPFIWIIGKPLKITTPLQKSDAIVVFAGGVGESGKAGQGYLERLNYAVELYREGYAPRIIFSSGYSYVFKEAETMKVLAMSLGVPENSLVLEENAHNTYENVKFSGDILTRNNWNKAILISSPYNMLRSSLVCRKITPGIRFIYAPVLKSGFYGDETKVEFKHIRAILHEYIAIILYYFKGYL